MLDYYEIKVGTRVRSMSGKRTGTIYYVFTGSLDGAVDVRWDDGKFTVERGYTLRKA